MWRPQNTLILTVLLSAVILIGNATEFESLDNDPLEVFVVPHSHCDPGWWWSFEEYYNKWTKGIISSIVESLSQDPKRHFIWAEISYFQRWWSDQNDEIRDKARRLISRGQLEFVTGGWVMNDEASVHYVDIINQITEGNEWLHFNFGVTPKISWAIDPFGHSTTMPYLLKEMGFEGVIINRISTPSKVARRDNRELEFYWHQEWQSPKEGLFTHLFPYPYYDIPNTCGPNREVCETFDFETPKSIPITESNVKERAETLMNQYRQKAKAFRHNKLLIPLGDDFKYKNLEMITHIFTNYERLFKYINENYDQYRINIKWSNLTDYFTAAKQSSPSVDYPSYFGDFFTYTDRENDFWSGYFTSRPFLKGLIRKTQWLLRNVEQMFVFDYLKSNQNPPNGDEHSLVLREARRNMGLAQHHDAITGTARRDPTQDYIRRLKSSFDTLIKSMGDMLSRVLKIGSDSITATFVDVNKVIDVKNKKMVPIVLYNSLGQEREYVAKVTVNTNHITLKNSLKEDVPFQINFAFDPELTIMPDQYEIHFLARIPPLGTATFFVVESDAAQPVTEIAEISKSESTEVKLHNDMLEIKISPEKGTITSMKLNGQEKSFDHKYMQYKSSHKGGAYIFAPQGEATLISPQHSTVTVVKGPIVEAVLVRLTKDIKYRVNIYQLGDTQDHLEIINTVNLQSQNSELIMRLDSGVKNSGKFVVDKNGLGEIERTTVSSAPIASNYYPLTSGAYIVDKSKRERLEIITRQPMGVGSLKEGQLEVCLDRRLGQDDGRGLGETVTDNVRFEIPLFVTWSEHKETDEPTVSKKSYFINNPPVILFAELDSAATPQQWAEKYTTHTNPIQPLPDELFLQQFRLRDYDQKIKPNSEIIFRVVNGGQKHVEEGFNLKALFEDYSVARASSMSLSLMHTEQDLAKKKESSKRGLTLFDGKSVDVAPMEIKTFLVDLTATFNDLNRPTKSTTPIKGNNNGEDETYWMNKAKEFQKEVKRLEYENQSLKNQFDALQRRFDDAELQHSSIVQMRGLFIFSLFLLGLLFVLYNRKRVRTARSSPYHNNRSSGFNLV